MGLTRLRLIAANIAVAAFLPLVAVQQVQASTIDVGGEFVSWIIPVAGDGPTDYLRAAIDGTFTHDPLSQQATLDFTFQGDILDNTVSLVLGSVTGHIVYIFEDVYSQTIGGNDYLLATDPIGAPDDNGNGTGSFASLTINANGQSTSAVFDLEAKKFNTQNGLEFQPVTQFLLDNDLGAYLLSGLITNGNTNVTSIFAWMMSEAFTLGTDRYGNRQYQLFPDIHGESEIPEPASMLLLGAGVIGGLSARRRKA